MQLFKKILLAWTFYRSFFFFSSVLTVCGVSIFWKFGFSAFFALFWFKVFSLGGIYYFINSYKDKEFYYYRNLGISKTFLWAVTIAFDFIFFIFLIIQVYRFR